MHRTIVIPGDGFHDTSKITTRFAATRFTPRDPALVETTNFWDGQTQQIVGAYGDVFFTIVNMKTQNVGFVKKHMF